jgi:putative nucleotidyltransferase with HDIG domain
VLASTAAAAFLLAPDAMNRLPGPESLGQPAPATIKADRDYDILDPEGTARRRAEAVQAVLPVYDLDDGAAEEAAARVHAAFELMREEEAAVGGRAAEPEALSRRWQSQRDAFVSRLQLVVRDEDFQALERARFSMQVERELIGLAAKALTGMVVGDLKLLPADRDQGFVVRILRAGELQGERVVQDPALAREAAAVRDEVVGAGRALAGEPAPLRGAIVRLAAATVRPTLVYDQAETERRKLDAVASLKPVGIRVKRGEKIIGDGERIEKRHLVVFEGIRAQARNQDLYRVRIGGGGVMALLILLLWRFARRNMPRFRPTRRDALLLATLLTGTLALAWVGLAVADAIGERFPALPRAALYHVVPLAVGAMIVRQVLSAEVALLFAIGTGFPAGLLAGQSIGYALFATATSAAAAGVVGRGRERTGLFRAGAKVGVVGAAVVAAGALYQGRPGGELAAAMVAALVGSGVLLPVLVVGLLPVVEGAFGYVTDVKLLELANLNHPALKELIVQAPGTYHHSIVMGSMVEAAAQAVGANPLLAKVCAYYHDIGKVRNPLYFAENQRSGENRHDPLAPSMSSLIVKRHVTEGIELARHWRLPRMVVDTIAQHHGTRLVAYFWAKAQKAEGGKSSGVDEQLYRYPGPKPQTREAALVLIADACEASSRALDPPTGEGLRTLVSRRINEIFSEGQLDDCELTLRDLNAIARAMVSALEAIYHTRPEYPGKPREDAPRPPAVQLVGKP